MLGNVDQRRIVYRLHQSVAQNAQRGAKRTHRFRFRHALLNFGGGKGGVRTDRAQVNQRASLDDFRPVVDGNFRVLEYTVGALVPDPQLHDLTEAAGDRSLVALAARLCVEDRAEAVGDAFNLLECALIRLVRRIVCDPVALVVEAGGRLGRLWGNLGILCGSCQGCARTHRARDGEQGETDQSNPNHGLHGSLPGAEFAQIYACFCGRANRLVAATRGHFWHTNQPNRNRPHS